MSAIYYYGQDGEIADQNLIKIFGLGTRELRHSDKLDADVPEASAAYVYHLAPLRKHEGSLNTLYVHQLVRRLCGYQVGGFHACGACGYGYPLLHYYGVFHYLGPVAVGLHIVLEHHLHGGVVGAVAP